MLPLAASAPACPGLLLWPLWPHLDLIGGILSPNICRLSPGPRALGWVSYTGDMLAEVGAAGILGLLPQSQLQGKPDD